MAIKRTNKVSSEFSMSSMTDIIFLLLIFFILLSTMVSPNAVKLLLPSSNSKTIAKQNITVYIDENYQFYVEDVPVNEQQLNEMVSTAIAGIQDASVVLRADKTVPVQYIVEIIDVVNKINEETGNTHKVILATSPKN